MVSCGVRVYNQLAANTASGDQVPHEQAPESCQDYLVVMDRARFEKRCATGVIVRSAPSHYPVARDARSRRQTSACRSSFITLLVGDTQASPIEQLG
jgi:hypothetical protein